MSASLRNASLRQLAFLAGGFVALICVALLTLSSLRELGLRHEALKAAEVDVANIAQSLVQHADDSFELADSLVIGLVHRLETDGIGPGAVQRLRDDIDLRKGTMGRVRALFVYDAAGRWLATSESVNPALFNNSDRDYFKQHRASPDKGLLVGSPIRSRSGGQWVITASRRFDHPDGSFAGVVLATIDASYFANFYKRFDLGPTGVINLIDKSGIILARSVDNETSVGRDISSTPLIRDMDARRPAGLYYFRSPFDQTMRLSYYRLSERFPLLVLATEAKDEVLAPWRQEAIIRMALVLGLVALIASTGIYLVRQLLKGQRVAAVLAAKEADFRLLAEESSDMVMRIGFDERVIYVSPSCVRLLGWSAEQLCGTLALAGVNDEDLPHVRETVRALKEGEIEETRLVYRTRHRQGGEIWLETALRATRDPKTGKVNGVVAISRDMTEHKDLQERLATLATRDGLTGLANRRHFDDMLQQEWRRAERDGNPVSLVMMDVDNFKKFNDQYGHQAGDTCLKAVAKAIAAEARRPADLAARYGGEEFVLLLPNTDEVGCTLVAERIRAALEALKLPHALNPPTKRVTMSIDGATGWPNAETQGNHPSLIAAADRALYAAKHAGRDRFVMSGQVVAWRDADSA
ncbi:diguanylate cyclase domain-containing protein [Reyranella sp.]|uniref:diguanylate cyclase domain-containing protein n=1 Tax=Reyranella sp. TaxID=1929291 RepID=UPI00271BFC8F|nr:diguanylate cyclase [Reyranella sp.]MDO8973108.1 diguanylate cyclase [Reyranella sp.]